MLTSVTTVCALLAWCLARVLADADEAVPNGEPPPEPKG